MDNRIQTMAQALNLFSDAAQDLLDRPPADHNETINELSKVQQLELFRAMRLVTDLFNRYGGH